MSNLIGQKIETTNDNFGDMVRENCLLVDKTLMIKEFWEGQKMSLITRPRRFGKSLTLSMLQHFFAAEVNGIPTKGLFKPFNIAKVDKGKFLKAHQGQYPVISITFKDVKEASYEAVINKIRRLIKKLYTSYEALLNSSKLTSSLKEQFQTYLDASIDDEGLQEGLEFLSQFLFKACGKKPIILIDEYDAPLTMAHRYDFIEPLSNFMRNMFSGALKGNPYLEKGLMTGILRVSKNNMLSGLNNLRVYTVLNKEYGEYFGFIEEEVQALMRHQGITEQIETIKKFYNGYKIDGATVYNPWSTMQFIESQVVEPYWVMTSNDRLLKDIFLNSTDEAKTKFGELMQGKTLITELDVNVRYEDLVGRKESLWTLLLFCGYLTVENKSLKETIYTYELRIPNIEILSQYTQIFSHWFKEQMGVTYHSFMMNLVEGNVKSFTAELGDYLIESLSVRDVNSHKEAENFYHGFTVGLIASIRSTHTVESNKESGFGFYDVMLIPKASETSSPMPSKKCLGIILEFKHTKDDQNTKKEAKRALAQIEKLQYDAELKKHPHITHVLKVGLAFCKKSVRSAYQEEDLLAQSTSEVVLGKEYTQDDEDY